jgi:hypothetical protein
MVSFGRQKSHSIQESQNASQQASTGANISGSEQNVWGSQAPALGDLYASAQNVLGSGNALAQPAAQALQSQLTPGVNPYFSQSLDQAISAATQGFTRDVLPQLKSNAVGMNNLGTTRDQLATGEAAGMFGQGLTRMVADMSTQQYTADQNRALQALMAAPQISGMQWQPQQVAAGMIGGPTVLGSSFGQGWQTSQGTSQGTGSGYSKGSGFNFGIMS